MRETVTIIQDYKQFPEIHADESLDTLNLRKEISDRLQTLTGIPIVVEIADGQKITCFYRLELQTTYNFAGNPQWQLVIASTEQTIAKIIIEIDKDEERGEFGDRANILNKLYEENADSFKRNGLISLGLTLLIEWLRSQRVKFISGRIKKSNITSLNNRFNTFDMESGKTIRENTQVIENPDEYIVITKI